MIELAAGSGSLTRFGGQGCPRSDAPSGLSDLFFQEEVALVRCVVRVDEGSPADANGLEIIGKFQRRSDIRRGVGSEDGQRSRWIATDGGGVAEHDSLLLSVEIDAAIGQDG